MAARDTVTAVCRDCGEVGRFELAGIRAGRLAACPACGLVTDLTALRPPGLDATGALRAGVGAPGPRGPAPAPPGKGAARGRPPRRPRA